MVYTFKLGIERGDKTRAQRYTQFLLVCSKLIFSRMVHCLYKRTNFNAYDIDHFFLLCRHLSDPYLEFSFSVAIKFNY